VLDVSSWSQGPTVDIAGRDVINHAGAAALRLLADRSGLTGSLSRALARRGFVPAHDIADGGRVMSDLATSSRQMAALSSAPRAYMCRTIMWRSCGARTD
jgi:hypothetical protein